MPGNAGCTLAGTAQFTAESLVRGSLVYTVNAVQVTRTIERQALTPIEVNLQPLEAKCSGSPRDARKEFPSRPERTATCAGSNQRHHTPDPRQ